MKLSELKEIIAPCGMNCGSCLGYMRYKDHRPGCRTNDNSNEKAIVGEIVQERMSLTKKCCYYVATLRKKECGAYWNRTSDLLPVKQAL